jgi:hypothetical protein
VAKRVDRISIRLSRNAEKGCILLRRYSIHCRMPYGSRILGRFIEEPQKMFTDYTVSQCRSNKKRKISMRAEGSEHAAKWTMLVISVPDKSG